MLPEPDRNFRPVAPPRLIDDALRFLVRWGARVLMGFDEQAA